MGRNRSRVRIILSLCSVANSALEAFAEQANNSR